MGVEESLADLPERFHSCDLSLMHLAAREEQRDFGVREVPTVNRVMAPEELLASLRLAHQERPDLWHAWSALIQQLADMQRLDEALDLARKATGRFPLLPRLWLDLALVHQARLERAREIEALEQALEINPNWSYASRELALALDRDGQSTRARMIWPLRSAPRATAPMAGSTRHSCWRAISA